MEIKTDNNFCFGSQGRTLPEFSDAPVSLLRVCWWTQWEGSQKKRWNQSKKFKGLSTMLDIKNCVGTLIISIIQ